MLCLPAPVHGHMPTDPAIVRERQAEVKGAAERWRIPETDHHCGASLCGEETAHLGGVGPSGS